MSHAPEDGGYRPQGIAGKLGAMFINSKLTPIVVIASILLGLFAEIGRASCRERVSRCV